MKYIKGSRGWLTAICSLHLLSLFCQQVMSLAFRVFSILFYVHILNTFTTSMFYCTMRRFCSVKHESIPVQLVISSLE